MDESPSPHDVIHSRDGVAVRRTPIWSPERIAAERNDTAAGRLREQRDRDRARLDQLTTRVTSLISRQPRPLSRR
jgi:hypothetical protein